MYVSPKILFVCSAFSKHSAWKQAGSLEHFGIKFASRTVFFKIGGGKLSFRQVLSNLKPVKLIIFDLMQALLITVNRAFVM